MSDTAVDERAQASVTLALEHRYQIEHLLGRGGFGRVYRARQLSTGQAVAVKLLDLGTDLSALAWTRQKARFRREMSICAELAHPDIVTLIDYGETADSLYSVFELVPGETLAQLLRREGSLTLLRSRDLLRQLLDVLVYSHAAGVIHRDLKPSNLMVLGGPGRERIKVLDFGISVMSAGAAGALTCLTLSQEIIGTPAYAAPEQLRGNATTGKADLYSWGLMLLECVTGHNVMDGTSLGEIFQRQLSPDEVHIPKALREHRLGTLLRWVLEKDPARRASSAADVLARFDAIDLEGLADPAGFLPESRSDRPTTSTLRDTAGPAETAPAFAIEGQRRQVVALCARISLRSPAVAIDPMLLDAYQHDLFALCQSTVEEFGGRRVGSLGETALFYFGLQRARDTDARMALRASLELNAKLRARSAVMQAQSELTLSLHAGLHAGLLTAAERSEGWSVAHGLVASTTLTLAQHAAESSESAIISSDAFRQLTGRHGEFVETRPLHVSWQPDELCAHQLVGESLTDVFLEDVAPMVGRAVELAAVLKAWEESTPRGTVVVVRGEPGMGKSRLAHEFGRALGERGHEALTLRFAPESQHVALGPLLALVSSELGLVTGAPATCATISAALTSFEVDATSAVALLCTWLSVPLSAPFVPLPHSPQLQRAMLYRLLASLLVELLARRSRYLLVEDLQWADPSTLDWLRHYLEHQRGQGGFVLITTRPNVDWCWDEIEPLTIELKNLDESAVHALLSGLPFAAKLPAPVLAKLVERADGVPLFAEELARAVARDLGERPEPAQLEDVPFSLRTLLISRLDELGPAKDAAQFAAAIGREFDFELLRASIAKDEATLLADLDQLVSAGLVVVRRLLQHSVYYYRHALLRDAAYASMTDAARRRVHDAIASALSNELVDRARARPDLLALHLELADRPLQSQRYWFASGGKAMRDVAYDDARASFERGLALIAHCPPGAERNDAELTGLGGLLAANVVKLGFGAPELPSILARAQSCIDGGQFSPERSLPLLWGRYLFNTVRPVFRRALPIAENLLATANAAESRDFRLVAQSALIRCACWMGRFEAVDRAYAELDGLYEPSRLKQLMELTGEDSYMAAASFTALAWIARGQPKAGLAILERLANAQERTRIPGVVEGTWAQLAFGYLLCGMDDPNSEELRLAREYGQRARESAMRLGFPFWAGYGGLMEASAGVYQGDLAAVDAVDGAMQMFIAAGATIGFGWNYSTLAFGLLQRGQLDEAARALQAARQHVADSDERFFVAEQARIEARLLLARNPGDTSAVQAKLREAIALGQSQGANLFVARAEADLAAIGRG